MRVGVVLCMETPAHMLPEHGRYGDMFTNLLQAVDPRIRVDLFDAFTTARCLPSPSDPNIDCFLISGSPFAAYDPDEWVADLKQFIVTAFQSGKVLIGICFGHQIIAAALGGQVHKAPVGYLSGIREHSLVLSNPPQWFEPRLPFTRLTVSHGDQVYQLPPNATLLLSSDVCPIAGYFIEDRVLCFQQHPELSPAFVQGLITARIDRLAPDRYSEAMKSLVPPHHLTHITAATWIVNFIQQRQHSKASDSTSATKTSHREGLSSRKPLWTALGLAFIALLGVGAQVALKR
eukprot:c13845_g1_i1.p1 GENE.c13845_g1_i1~~c13845_g1_i1.p1  ORF type:complete len:290 (+),score=39.95 c13845_g1_i1:54-923(+)